MPASPATGFFDCAAARASGPLTTGSSAPRLPPLLYRSCPVVPGNPEVFAPESFNAEAALKSTVRPEAPVNVLPAQVSLLTSEHVPLPASNRSPFAVLPGGMQPLPEPPLAVTVIVLALAEAERFVEKFSTSNPAGRVRIVLPWFCTWMMIPTGWPCGSQGRGCPRT